MKLISCYLFMKLRACSRAMQPVALFVLALFGYNFHIVIYSDQIKAE